MPDDLSRIEEKMIRVFPRRTKWTPTDDLSFIGDPPLFRPPQRDVPVRISCTFTWDIQESLRLQRSWERFYSDVQVGGPAFDDPGAEFVPGRFIKEGVTITSRGCSKNCDWCLVPKREGWIRELPIKDGWDVADNNLLACSRKHIESVFEMLRRQPDPIKFSGGLDAEMLQEWHVDLLKSIKLKFAWFGCDYPGAIVNLQKAAELLVDFPVDKKHCYVLIGFNGEQIKTAEKRILQVYELGFLPYAMLYRGPDTLAKNMSHPLEWRELQRWGCMPWAYKRYGFDKFKRIRKNVN